MPDGPFTDHDAMLRDSMQAYTMLKLTHRVCHSILTMVLVHVTHM